MGFISKLNRKYQDYSDVVPMYCFGASQKSHETNCVYFHPGNGNNKISEIHKYIDEINT